MDKRISCVIVDDEERARNYLFKIVNKHCPEVFVAGTGANVKEGIGLINREKPQLIFLDIEMPDGTGFDVLKGIEPYSFEVIFVTGYNDHAIQAIKVNALDYLLKPLDTDELKTAVKKAESKINNQVAPPDFSELLQQMTGKECERNRFRIPSVRFCFRFWLQKPQKC